MNFLKSIFHSFYDYSKIPISILSLEKNILFSTLDNLKYLNEPALAIFPEEEKIIHITRTLNEHMYASFKIKIDNDLYNILIGPNFIFNPEVYKLDLSVDLHFVESVKSFENLAIIIFKSVMHSDDFKIVHTTDYGLNLNTLLFDKIEESRIKKIGKESDYLLIQTYLVQFIIAGDYSNTMTFLNKFINSLYKNFSSNALQSIKYNIVVSIILLSHLLITSGIPGTIRIRSMAEIYIKELDDLTNENDIHIFLKKLILDYITVIHDNSDYSHNIAKSIQFINNNIYEKFTVSDIAEFLDLSSAYLTTLFKQETGSNLKTYIQTRRINEAKILLTYTDFTIEEISKKLQFYSSAYFRKIFKAQTDQTPKEYRIRNVMFL